MLLIKKLRLGLHLARGMLTAATLFPFLSQPQKDRRIRAWSQKLLKLCGMHLEVEQHAPVPEGGVMLLCNHVSWIDIFALNAWQPVRFVAKAEIRHWPLVGWLCVQTRTIFLQRERRADARRIMHYLADCLRDGDVITVFPEGTTTDGRSLLPFHANLLQAPVTTGKPVQPLCLFYTDAASGRHTMAPAYIGETSLIESIDMILRAPPMTVRLSIGAPQYPQDGEHRREFTLGAQRAVGAALQGFLPEAVLPESGSVGSRASGLGDDESDAVQAVQA
ncbi:glycerol acyltransferase [Pandoraea anapnoica]|uniref:Glycerol acyltransferase n=1 Tax=Pandoraea anapnoica TaxID=2508301 RepID=A0A5E4ZS19_9BURK|nr:lysophospholipid acyltransferase family protein [Pandoraea anapnoica]VVE63668.1 glycerol acyltransferase [Pandoraea anapnoica]